MRRHEHVEARTGPRLRACASAASCSQRWSLQPHKHAPKSCTTETLRLRLSARRRLSCACTIAIHELISVASLSSSASMLIHKTSMRLSCFSSLIDVPACGKIGDAHRRVSTGEENITRQTRKRFAFDLSTARACSIRDSARASRSLGAVLIATRLQRQLAPCCISMCSIA